MAAIDDEIKTRFQNNKHRLLVNMVFTSNWIQNSFEQELKPFGISNQQFNVLRILRGANTWKNMNEIKSLMIDKTPNTTRLSDKLLDKGLIDRRRSEDDRRVVFLQINDRGRELLEEIDKKSDLNFLKKMEHISEEEAQRMSELIDQIRKQ